MIVRRGAFFIGIGLFVIGGYLFLQSMIMITNYTYQLDWTIWTIYLTVGIILFSIGPGIMAWAFAGKYQTSYKTTQWPTIRIPRICSECSNPIEVNNLE
jgi:hypothetical protein